MNRYTLAMPDKLMKDLKARAKKSDATVKEIVQQCLKFALAVREMSDDDRVQVTVTEGGKNKTVTFIF